MLESCNQNNDDGIRMKMREDGKRTKLLILASGVFEMDSTLQIL